MSLIPAIPQWLASASLASTFLFLYPTLRTLLFFAYQHTLHRSTLPSYLLSPKSHALITGSSGGIGRSLAKEFLKRGWNVIIHGRSARNLAEVKEELDALGTGRDVKVWVQDAEAEVAWDGLAEREWAGLEITVLVNCVGGTEPTTVTIDQQDPSYLSGCIHMNALFPFYLTRALLPHLRTHPRALVLTIGSKAGEFPAPYLAAYCSSKAFLELFVRCMDTDERLVAKSGVNFQFFQTAQVRSKIPRFEPSWQAPHSDEYARAAVHAVGAGRWKVHPYWGHAVLGGAMACMSDAMVERMIWGIEEARRKSEAKMR